MANDYLSTYLNDHLAGSVAALELLEHMEKTYAETDLEPFFSKLRADIASDRKELEGLMSRLGITQSGTRRAVAWITEKFTELKLRIEDPSGGALRLMETFEALATGIDGKRALWRALEAAAEVLPELQGVDYARLEARADEQRKRVESRRLEAAKLAFGPEPPSEEARGARP